MSDCVLASLSSLPLKLRKNPKRDPGNNGSTLASMADMGAGFGMLIVETIAKIRRAYLVQKKPIKVICREFRVSRKVVRKVIRHWKGSRHCPLAEEGLGGL